MTLPWYIYASLIIAGIFLFKNFYEGIVWVVVVEILYGPASNVILDHSFLVLMLALGVLALLVKQSVRFYD